MYIKYQVQQCGKEVATETCTHRCLKQQVMGIQAAAKADEGKQGC